MTIAQRIRAGVERALVVEMEGVTQRLEEQAPIPDSTAPPFEELERILADLQRSNPTRRHVFLKRTV